MIAGCLVGSLGWIGLAWAMPGLAGGLLGLALPVLLMAVAAGLAVSVLRLRSEASRLRAELVALKTRGATDVAIRSASSSAIEALADDSVGEDRSVPAVEMSADLSVADLIAALQFPENAEDAEGFEILARARTHPRAGPVVQAAQDMMTLMAAHGIYTDDLALPDLPPGLWRRLGARGAGEAPPALPDTGAGASEAVAVCKDLMVSDTVFRDTADHFQRRFEAMLADLAPDLDEAEIAALGQTRSAVSYRLVATAAQVPSLTTA